MVTGNFYQCLSQRSYSMAPAFVLSRPLRILPNVAELHIKPCHLLFREGGETLDGYLLRCYLVVADDQKKKQVAKVVRLMEMHYLCTISKLKKGARVWVQVNLVSY